MALIDKASLLMVPSTYEAGKLYNVLPSGNRAPDSTDQNSGYDQTRADFDFDRGSNAAATRVNADGLIEKYRENLLVHSNSFDVSANWGLQDATLTNGQSGYDGSLNAWLFSHSSSTAYLYQQKTLSVSVNTASIYVKKGTSSTIRLEFVTASFGKGAACSFDLENGTAGSITHYGTSSGFIANIDDVSNGWFRISLTGVTTAETWYHELALTSGNIFIQSAQLESGLVATEYLNSTSVTGKAGVLVDLPRINYDANGENGALLLEPSRQNLVTQSEYFDASQWTNYYSTISSNDSTSPDGFENATRWTSTASGTFLTTSLFISDPSNLSVFVKYVDHPYIHLYSGASGGDYANFDIQNNTIGTSGYNTSNEKIESYGNGWYRISCTFSNVSAGSTARIGFAQSLTSNWGGLNTSAAGDVLIYGAQLEAGSYPTSYIPNHGESGGVTRAADSCSVTGVSDVIGQTEGTVYLEFEIDNLSESGNEKVLFYMKDTGTGERYLSFVNNGSLTYIESNGAVIANISKTGLSVGSYKAAIAYKTNDFAFYLNGEQVGTDNAGTPSGFSTFGFQYYNSAVSGTQFTKQTALFNERLSNAELATLTTL
jgi:hypothetical protein